MGRKKRVNDYYQKRNGLSVSSLGDKSYKSPLYQTGFFHETGLIPGSTNKVYKRNFAKKNEVDFTISAEAKYPFYPTVKWEDRVRNEQKKQELHDVDELEKWEETILKEHLGKGKDEEQLKSDRRGRGAAKKDKKKKGKK